MFIPVALNLEYIAANILDVVDEVKIVNQEFDRSPIEAHIRDFEPDLFGLTLSATEHRTGLDLCKRAKRTKKGLKTIVGGFHPTALQGKLLQHKQIDMVAVGEAEMTMRELVQKGDPEGVKGIVYRDRKGKYISNPPRPVVKDLDTLPFPARHLRNGDECELGLKRFGYHRDQLHTSRGCWGKCTFCCEPNMSKSKQRYRRPEKVMEELNLIYEMHHKEPMWILLGDPHFMGRPKYTEKVCDLIIQADYDIHFTAMVRADMIAKHPKIAAKMVKAGVVGYCLGLESPAVGDLGHTKKFLKPQAQFDAVRIMRRNHAVVGGTFVCGLENHIEEEILMFPEYARHLGMLNAAFPIATPHAATEFYKELEKKGLIKDRDWTHYDQMHRVFKHKTLTRKRSEELLTHCLGRFYALDILLDDMISEQYRNAKGHKMTLHGAFLHLFSRMFFLKDASATYDTIEEGSKMGKIFFKAQVNPHTRIRTEAIGIDNVIDVKDMLSILGPQKFVITIRHGRKPFANYVLRTDSERVRYLDICEDRPDDATFCLTLDIEDFGSKGPNPKTLAARTFKRLIKESHWSTLGRLSIALLADRLSRGAQRDSKKMIRLPDGYYDHFCASDDWDEERYLSLKVTSSPQ